VDPSTTANTVQHDDQDIWSNYMLRWKCLPARLDLIQLVATRRASLSQFQTNRVKRIPTSPCVSLLICWWDTIKQSRRLEGMCNYISWFSLEGAQLCYPPLLLLELEMFARPTGPCLIYVVLYGDHIYLIHSSLNSRAVGTRSSTGVYEPIYIFPDPSSILQAVVTHNPVWLILASP